MRERPAGLSETVAEDPVSLLAEDRAMGGRVGRALSPAMWLPGAVGLGLAALVWQLEAGHIGDVTVFPGIGAIWQAFWSDPTLYLGDARWTIEETAVGLGVSFGLAFLIAVAMSQSRIVARGVLPLAVVLNVTPVVALAPGLTLLFGVGLTPRFVVTGMIVFFPILVNSLIGLRSIDPRALEVLQSLHASRLDILLRLRIPSSLPFIFAAARICFPVALVGAVVAEFTTSSQDPGLGLLIQTAAQSTNAPVIYAAVACLAVLGLALTVVVTLLEAWLLSWHPMRRNR